MESKHNMPEEQSLRVALPESLRRQFGGLEKRLFSLESWVAITGASIFLFGSFFLFFISDRFWDTPTWLRIGFALGGLLGVAWSVIWWMNRWVFRRRGLRELSTLVQRRYRRLGDRLLGIVELADELKRPPNFSPELYRAAIEQVSEEANKYDFLDAVSSRRVRLDVYVTAGLMLLVLVPAVLLPEATWNAFKRWVLPMAAVPRFTLVQMADLSKEQVVPHGENFTIRAKVKYRSFWQPVNVSGLIPGQPPIFGKVKGGELELNVPGQMQNQKIHIKVGDTRQVVEISPKHRPGLEKIMAEVALPDYLGYPVQTNLVQGGQMNVLEGSRVKIVAEASRPLASADAEMEKGAMEGLEVQGNRISTPEFGADVTGRLSLNWKDQFGLTNALPWNVTINLQKDAAAVPEFMELYRDTAILESEVLPIKLQARDDYGVKSLGLDWQMEEGESSTNTLKKEFEITSSNQQGQVLEHTFNFSPAVLRIPPDSSVEVRAYATDFFPGRERSESPVYRIHVLGNARHAEMIRQNLESLLVRLEEVTRLEERIASETREMKELQKLDTPEAAEKIAQLMKAQEQNAAQLQEVAEEGMKTLREALRNPAFSEELLTQWTKDLHQMQKLSEQQMKEASKSLQSASDKQEGREENLSEALKKEEEAIDALQEMQKKVNEGLDELQALTLSQRLRKVSSEQKRIEGNLQKNISDTVGLTPPELPPRYQKANVQFATMQLGNQAESHKLQGEISRFYERTQKPNYGEVSTEMAEAKPAEELEKIRGLIQENIGMEAMQNLSVWADKFKFWADKLEPAPSNESGGGEGSGQGEQQPNDSALKQLLALLRIRERQVNIQDRTELLNEYLEEKNAYRDGAVLLAASQSKLNRDLTKQAVDNPFAMLEEPYSETMGVMSDVEGLLDRPQTDQVTRETQDKSINLLSDLINLLNEQAKRGQGNSSSSSESSASDEMGFMMQMMAPQLTPGMQAGQSGGGNMSGGSTEEKAEEAKGDATGKAGDARSVRKASGVPQNYPTEYRPTLEKYFKALEQDQK